MNNKPAHRVALSGLFLALGLALPYFTSHTFGLPGTILLPMHLPVLLCGLICGSAYGGILGIFLPLASSFLTGMPAFYPMLPIMIVQLSAMGILSGLIYRQFKLSIYISIFISMVIGWISYGLTYSILTLISGETLRALAVTAAIMQGIPGIIVQLIFVPVIINSTNRYFEISKFNEKITGLPEALDLIRNGGVSFVIIKNDEIVYSADGRGISPILKLYDQDKTILENAFVVDKIIGKAAAMILVSGKVDKVYGETMSVAACNFLKDNHIDFQFGKCSDVIVSRDKKGICPIEQCVLKIDDPLKGIAKIKETISFLSENAG